MFKIDIMYTNLGGGYLSDPQVAHELVTSPEAHQLFGDVINKGEFNFRPRTISLPELPILDSSPTPIIPSRFPVLGAKFGESKKMVSTLLFSPLGLRTYIPIVFFLDSCF